ncbi:hypothetical protein AAMO2058_001669400 [Amorphochlora amoebiformis]|mmetsp:Transcript_22259/g.35035  ORF Transcript_22259/g.35035 Transcript_22259/m.35035 type:complete len:236 (-) Transcript_22259:364-1071(-)|eukprot:879084-Amorphochlora_amoeboformis.AAC.1
MESAEAPLACFGIGLSVLTILWQTQGHACYIPGYDAIWGTGESFQYPRRPGNDLIWRAIYASMYGFLGTAAQYSGLRITTDRLNRKKKVTKTTQQRARLFGLFHSVLGVHHTLWSVVPGYGRLDLSHYDMPWLQGFALMQSVYTGYQGVRLLLTEEGSSFRDVVRRKTIADASSAMTVIGAFGFLFMNWFGLRDRKIEKALWVITFTAPAVVFPMEAYFSSKANSKDDGGEGKDD